MELFLGLLFWGLVIYYFVRRSKRKKLEQQGLLQPSVAKIANQGKRRSIKKIIGIVLASIVGIFVALFIFGLIVGPQPKKESEEGIADMVETPIQEPAPAKNIDVNIFKERDTSFASRKRIQVDAYAPNAITNYEREKTLESIAQRYVDQGYDYTQVYLRPTAEADYNAIFGSFGFIEVIPDGCGLSGKDCNGKKLNKKISDYVLTEVDQNYIDAYIKNHRLILFDFNQDPENWTIEKSQELDNEFNEAMGKDLGVDPEDIPVFMIF